MDGWWMNGWMIRMIVKTLSNRKCVTVRRLYGGMKVQISANKT